MKEELERYRQERPKIQQQFSDLKVRSVLVTVYSDVFRRFISKAALSLNCTSWTTGLLATSVSSSDELYITTTVE